MTERHAHFESYRLTLTPLSPLHVGTGESVEPYQYDIAEGPPAHVAIYDVDVMLENLTEIQRRDFIRLTETTNFADLRRWFRKHPQRDQYLLTRLVLTPLAYEGLVKNLDNPNQQGEVQLLPRDRVTQRCYIPGSSIKGALRTAIVDAAARQPDRPQYQLMAVANNAYNRWSGAQFEAQAMGNLNRSDKPDLYRDPFRQVAVSDLAVPEHGTYVDRIRILKPQGSMGNDPSGIVMYRELTRSQVLQEPIAITGEFRLHSHLKQELPLALPLTTIIDNCNQFYQVRLKHELNKYNKIKAVSERMLGSLNQLATNQCLIRLGRHSHFECVTVGEPYHQAPQKGFGATRSYAGGTSQGTPFLPLGWAILTFDRPA